jgi:hypothetical protein
MIRRDFLTSPHSHTRTQRSSTGLGWADLQREQSHTRAFEGFINAALAGAVVWALFAMLMVCLWGVML